MAVILADCIKLIESKEVPAVTGMKSCEFTYEWTIENFKRLCKEKIESPSISSHCADFDDEWILKYYPFWSSLAGIKLQLKSFNNTSELQTKWKISINNKNEITMKYNFCKLSEEIKYDNFRIISKLRHLIVDELKIRCTITITQKLTNNSNVISSFDAKQQLSADLKKILLNEQSTDVTIQVGQKSFRAIKGILGARSPVFSAMFDHEQFKENKNNEVVIDDIEEDVFEEFLHYIYTDESPNVEKMPMELLAVAEKYQVDCLKNICEEIICGTINFDDVASILIYSNKYDLKKLNEKCLEFIKKNLRAVMSNKIFKVYKKKYPEVFVGVLEQLLTSQNKE